MKTIATFDIPGQFSVQWVQDELTGTHNIMYGVERHWFSTCDKAFADYTSCCRHAANCAGWLTDENDSE